MDKRTVTGIFYTWQRNWPSAPMFRSGDLANTVTLWADSLADIDSESAQLGARLSIQTREFPPNIAQFRGDCQKATESAHAKADFWLNELRNLLPGNREENSLESADDYIRHTPGLEYLRDVVDSMGGIAEVYCADRPFLDAGKFKRAVAQLETQRGAAGKLHAGGERRLRGC